MAKKPKNVTAIKKLKLNLVTAISQFVTAISLLRLQLNN